ncbi:hypothetical protein [Azoarcus sp. KH32C]|nr:hypothetical protein [Azoarcus sp. KH32C]
MTSPPCWAAGEGWNPGTDPQAFIAADLAGELISQPGPRPKL